VKSMVNFWFYSSGDGDQATGLNLPLRVGCLFGSNWQRLTPQISSLSSGRVSSSYLFFILSWFLLMVISPRMVVVTGLNSLTIKENFLLDLVGVGFY
jgi:hypothetical protein